MFDRIAGVYDLMNTAMTAGLHHRWRERAADLARVGPGSRVLDVATGTGDLAIELARRVSPGGEVVGCDFAEAMLARARAKASAAERSGACSRASSGATRWSCPTRMTPSTRPRWASAPATSPDLGGGLREMARVVRPGGRVVVLEITTPTQAAAVALLRAVVRPPRARARAAGGHRSWRSRHGFGEHRRPARSPTPTPTCPTRSSASRRPPCWPPRWSARGCATSATCSRPAASSPSTPAPVAAERA